MSGHPGPYAQMLSVVRVKPCQRPASGLAPRKVGTDAGELPLGLTEGDGR